MLIIVILFLASGLIYIVGSGVQSATKLVENGCFMSIPCKGKDIEINISDIAIDWSYKKEDKTIILSGVDDSRIPILVLMKNNHLEWAKKLDVSDCLVNERLENISSIRVVDEEYFRINFLDDIYGEISTIYFDENFNFEVLCFSSM